MPKSGEELFSSGELLDNAVADAILHQEAEEYARDLHPPADEYASRRRFIGPAADTTHPEFGRANRPEETFGIHYHVTTGESDLSGPGDKALHGTVRAEEFVYDINNRVVFRNTT